MTPPPARAHFGNDGGPVSWRELNLVVQPLKDRLEAVGETVEGLDEKLDQVLLSKAANEGGEQVKKSFLDRSRFWAMFGATILSGTVAAIITFLTVK